MPTRSLARWGDLGSADRADDETTRRIPRVINDARARPEKTDADVSAPEERESEETPAAEQVEPAAARRRKKPVPPEEPLVDDEPARRRLSLPLVPVLSLLLVLLLGAGAFLWFTRAEPSSVTTEDYVGALQAARSNVVDFTSFDHLTLDDDIEQVRRVSVGDLRDEAVEQLESRRQQITESEAIVSTEVIDAGVTRANDEEATVLLVIQTTRETNASEQAEVVKYRIEVEMQRDGDRWVLSAIRGA
jgi:Mce-associated membrane protein